MYGEGNTYGYNGQVQPYSPSGENPASAPYAPHYDYHVPSASPQVQQQPNLQLVPMQMVAVPSSSQQGQNYGVPQRQMPHDAQMRPDAMYTQGDKLPLRGRNVHPLCFVNQEATQAGKSRANENDKKSSKSCHKLCFFLSAICWIGILWSVYCLIFADCYEYCEYDFEGDCYSWGWKKKCDAPCWQSEEEWYSYMIYGGFGVIYLFYLVEAFLKASTAKYLNNVADSDTIESWVNQDWRKHRAEIKWIVQNYHTVTTTDSKGNSQTRRVNTQKFEKFFKYSSMEDVSGEYDLNQEKSYGSPLVKLQFEKKLEFSNVETENLYNNQLRMFAESSTTDVCQDFTMDIVIPTFQFRVMCQSGSVCCFNWGCYAFWTLFGFSWLYRLYIDSVSDRKSFSIVKRIHY